MLYDKKWDTKVEQPSLDGLIAWLETQPSDTTYPFTNPDSCLIANYLQAIGVKNYFLNLKEITNLLGMETYYVIAIRPWTYGAALQRAREELIKKST